MLLGWDWIAFVVGLFGAFIMEFTRFIRQVKIPTQTFVIAGKRIGTSKINKLAFITSFIYILVGGSVSGLFANTIQEAFLYGGLWQIIFTYYIRLKIDK